LRSCERCASAATPAIAAAAIADVVACVPPVLPQLGAALIGLDEDESAVAQFSLRVVRTLVDEVAQAQVGSLRPCRRHRQGEAEKCGERRL